MKYGELLLQCFQEEAAEVIKEASKCNRFTLDHTHPSYDSTNLERLIQEFRELVTVASLIEGYFGIEFDYRCDPLKVSRVLSYIEVSKKLGVLE